MQDNGTQVRTGDTVWDELFEGDGGGLAFIATAPHLLVLQYVQAQWSATSTTAYRDPMTRNPGWPSGAAIGPEDANSSFYSGAATVVVPAAGLVPQHTRLAIGTTRVWISDDLGIGVGPNTWRTLPYPNGPAADGRPGAGGTPTAASMLIGQANPTLGSVTTMAWASTTELLVAYTGGIVRYTENPRRHLDDQDLAAQQPPGGDAPHHHPDRHRPDTGRSQLLRHDHGCGRQRGGDGLVLQPL